mmetsp:Transcript_2333/g.2980  ORF Transcript_2333/g.2980 Transcript_2333/m.2980 type:complete len:139 (-) Transcript_2333:1361-1777(-)
MVSDDLIWACLRNNSSFLRKQKGNKTFLSAEPGNVRNVHSFKYSGLANSKSISVNVTENGAELVKKSSTKNKPAKMSAKISLKNARGPARNNKTIEAAVSKVYYRRDLLKETLARHTAIAKAAARKQNGVTFSVSGRK